MAYEIQPVDSVSKPLSVTIASGGSLSAAVKTGGRFLTGVMMPATWTAADLTFQGSVDGVTFYDVYDEDDAEVLIEAAQQRYITVLPQAWLGLNYIKVRSGTTGTPVAQAAERVVLLMLGSAA